MVAIALLAMSTQSCKEVSKEVKETVVGPDTLEYFLLRPELEKLYGYSHAVKIGDDLKISGQLIEIDMDAHKAK